MNDLDYVEGMMEEGMLYDIYLDEFYAPEDCRRDTPAVVMGGYELNEEFDELVF